MRLLAYFLANSDSGSRVKILDIGGTAEFWTNLEINTQNIASIVLLNLHKEEMENPLITSCQGDATNLTAYNNQEFDVVFSNSVIEHVGNFKNQQKMAGEVKRVGKRFFLQTPNKWFPIEPHFIFPFFQFLPRTLQALLLKYFNLGSYKKTGDFTNAAYYVKKIRLLTKKELVQLFPKAKIYKEKVLGLTKSFVVYG
jgi:ubiquinone/menaquinone biosynthesis C-methylase UbiE